MPMEPLGTKTDDEGWIPISMFSGQESKSGPEITDDEGWIPIDNFRKRENAGIIRGYDISRYATDPTHEAKVAKWTEQAIPLVTEKDIDSHIKSIAPNSPITGRMILNASEKYAVDPAVMIGLMRQDSTFGTRGKAVRTFNPGNVGNDDTGKEVNYGSWDKGVEAVAAWLDKHREGEEPRGPSLGIVKEVGQGLVKGTTRPLGIIAGARNALHAFAMGGFKAANMDPEGWKELPFWQKMLVATGGAFQSAWDSVSKEGSYGAGVNDFVKYTTGKPIAEHLPEDAKWLEPSIEFIGSMILDPTIGIGTASKIIAKIGTKQAFGELADNIPKHLLPELQVAKLPENTLADLKTATDELAKLEAGEKAELRSRLMDLLGKRLDYHKWVTEWGNKQLDAYEMEQRGTRTIGVKPLEPEVRLWEPRPSIVDDIVPVGTPVEVPKQVADLRHKIWERQYKSESRHADPFEKWGGETGALRLPDWRWSNTNAAYWAELKRQNPSLEKVSGSIGEVTKDSSLPSLDDLQEKMLDRFVRIAKVSKEGYEEARKFSSYRDVANIEFNELGKALQLVRNEEEAFRNYITALRDETRARMIKSSDVKPTGTEATREGGKWFWKVENPGGVTLEEAREARKAIEEGYAKLYGDSKPLKEAADAFNQWTRRNILDPLHDSGIISDDAYKAIVKDNDFYATFQVIEHIPKDPDKIPVNLPGKEYFSVANQDIIRGLKGTEKQIRDPIEATLEKFMDAKSIIARNKVVSTFVDDILTDPQSPLHEIMRPVAANPKQFEAMQKVGARPVMEGSLNNEWGTLSRFYNGKVEKYAVPIDIAEAMKGLYPKQAPRAVQAINSIFRQTATSLYLPFTISQAMLDALMAYTTSGAYRTLDIGKYAAGWTRGLIEGLKHEFGTKSKVVKEYLESGGGMGYVGDIRDIPVAKRQLFDEPIKEAASRIIKSPKDLIAFLTSPLKPIEKLSSAVELAPRIAVFQRSKMLGESAEQAAMAARNATIDFQRSGTAMRLINQWVPFLNARVQARVTLADALKRDWKETAAKAFLSTVIPGIGAYAWNRLYFSELYDDIPDYIRQNYFTFIYGTDKNKYGNEVPAYFVIPKGDIGQMVFNPIEYAMDAFATKDRQNFLNFATDWIANLSPVDVARDGEISVQKGIGSILPPALKGAIENVTNRSFFTGREIEPYYMKDLPQEMRYKEDTPKTYKLLSEKLGLASPLKWQNAMQNLFAGYGREGLDPSSMLKGLTGRLTKTTGGAKEDRAWDVYLSIEEAYNHTRARADKLFEEGKRQEAIRMMVEWNRELPQKIKKMEETGFKDKGGMRRDFTFTPTKIRNLIIKPQRMDQSPLEKRLSAR